MTKTHFHEQIFSGQASPPAITRARKAERREAGGDARPTIKLALMRRDPPFIGIFI